MEWIRSALNTQHNWQLFFTGKSMASAFIHRWHIVPTRPTKRIALAVWEKYRGKLPQSHVPMGHLRTYIQGWPLLSQNDCERDQWTEQVTWCISHLTMFGNWQFATNRHKPQDEGQATINERINLADCIAYSFQAPFLLHVRHISFARLHMVISSFAIVLDEIWRQ